MLSFQFKWPVSVEFGEGCRHNIGKNLAGRYHRVLLVCSKGPFHENGLYKSIKDSIEANGIEVLSMSDIDSNPKIHSAEEGADICKKEKADCVIGIGGGSAMDCAKVIAAAAAMNVEPSKFFWGDVIPVTESLDTVMIPTIASTGTETNPWAVIVDSDSREKKACQCYHAKQVYLDPEIVSTVPVRLAVWGAVDILTHTFEFYFNGYNQSEWSMSLSEAIIKSVVNNVDKMIKDPSDLIPRGELLWLASMAWGGLNWLGRGEPDMACHAIEESVSGNFDTHHGGGLAVIVPRWMEKVYKNDLGTFARFGRNIWAADSGDDEKATAEGIASFRRWLANIGAPKDFTDLSADAGFSRESLVFSAEKTWELYAGNVGRIKKWTLEEIKQLLFSGLKP